MKLKQGSVEALKKELLDLYEHIDKADLIDIKLISNSFFHIDNQIKNFSELELAENVKAMIEISSQLEEACLLVAEKRAQVKSELNEYIKNTAKLKAYKIPS